MMAIREAEGPSKCRIEFPISIRIKELSDSASGINKELDELQKRLTPILSAAPPEEDNEPETLPPTCGMEDQLQSILAGLAEARTSLSRLLTRLQL